MKLRILPVVLAGLFVTLSANAQEYTFKVLANKGANEVKSGDAWKPLKTGASLKKGDELKLTGTPYLAMVHSSGKTMEIKEPGNLKVSELDQKVAKGGSSVASKYADFILSKMSAEAKKNRLSATGAVDRGLYPIQLHMPFSADFYGTEGRIEWETTEKGDHTYEIKFLNMFEDVIHSDETTENHYDIDFNQGSLKGVNTLLVLVKIKGDSEGKYKKYLIKRLPSGKSVEVKSNLNELMSDLGEESAINNFILAGFFEDNNLMIDALNSYQKAVELAPEVAYYQEAYEEFLYRNNFKKPKVEN